MVVSLLSEIGRTEMLSYMMTDFSDTKVGKKKEKKNKIAVIRKDVVRQNSSIHFSKTLLDVIKLLM